MGGMLEAAIGPHAHSLSYGVTICHVSETAGPIVFWPRIVEGIDKGGRHFSEVAEMGTNKNGTGELSHD